MKATLEFILPEENNEFKLATKGSDFFCTLWNIKELLREYEKYGMELEKFIERLREELYDANLDEIE